MIDGLLRLPAAVFAAVIVLGTLAALATIAIAEYTILTNV